MAQTIAHFSAPSAQRQQLLVEKVCVIAGFLVGLAVAVGVVSGVVAELGAPDWLEFIAAAATVAVTTRLGLSAAAVLSRKLAA